MLEKKTHFNELPLRRLSFVSDIIGDELICPYTHVKPLTTHFFNFILEDPHHYYRSLVVECSNVRIKCISFV